MCYARELSLATVGLVRGWNFERGKKGESTTLPTTLNNSY